jgi:uncharacterized membrane protein YidH (DUF202 family)
MNVSTDLAIQRTKLANQRTYLAYLRTGFAIASIAGTFKKMWICAFGIIMIVLSSIQYLLINYNLKNNLDINTNSLDIVPVIYVILSLGTLYLQMKK